MTGSLKLTDSATSTDDWDQPGFAFDSKQTEFETLDCKIVKDIAEIISHEFRRKVDLLDEKQHKEQNERCLQAGRLCFRSSDSAISIKLRDEQQD